MPVAWGGTIAALHLPQAGRIHQQTERCLVKRRKNFSEPILIAAVLFQVVIGLITVIRR